MKGLQICIMLLTVALVLTPFPSPSPGASHREAPLIALDAPADITDFFMFRSYESGKADRVVFIVNVFPAEEPSGGPNYYNFDDNVLYTIYIDNDMDNVADDVRFEFRFKTEIRGTVDAAGLFLSYLGKAGSPFPPITALDGAGSEGLGLRQKYKVTEVRGGRRRDLSNGFSLIAVPSNVGPRTMPTYESLALQGIYTLPNGMRVFAGQRDDPFYIDLGGVFDTLNLRRDPPVLTAAEDANDAANAFGVDMLSGFNVHTIALEVPATLITRPGVTRIGAYASTSRRRVRVEADDHSDRADDGSEDWVQVQRMANPLINETIIGTKDKDRWNSLRPEREQRFLDYYLNPRLALALQLIVGVPAATSGRTDLVNLLLKYSAADERLSELLRLDLTVAATPLPAQQRMTVLAAPADPAGWPNGRRPKDDVTDIAVRVVGGPNYVAARAADGVNVNDRPLTSSFPFLPTPWDGRDRVHDNP